jgi:hypothetical protein
MASPQSITVRIQRKASHEAIGAGWLCETNLIASCAHVVNAALGRPLGCTEQPSPTEEVNIIAPRVEGQTPVSRNWRVIHWEPPVSSKFGGFEGDVAFLGPISEGFSKPSPVLAVRPTHLARCDVFGFSAENEVGRSGSGQIGELAGSRYEIVPESAAELPQRGFSGAPVMIGREVAGIVSSVQPNGRRAYFIPVSDLLKYHLNIKMLPAIATKYPHIRDLCLELMERDQRENSASRFDLRGEFLEDYAQIENYARKVPGPSYATGSISPDAFFESVVVQNKAVLLSAPGGSGKTHFMIDVVRSAMDKDYVPFWLDFSRPSKPSPSTLSAESIFSQWSLAGGFEAFLAAGQQALIIGDGLNERSDLREQIATELALVRRTRSAPVILGDRLAQRRSQENFQLATLSPLSVEVIRQHVGAALGDVESWKRLLSSPFFLALYLKVRGSDEDPLARKEMFRIYFCQRVFKDDLDKWSPLRISLAAYNVYKNIKSRAAPRSKWKDEGFKDSDLDVLLEAGAVTIVDR